MDCILSLRESSWNIVHEFANFTAISTGTLLEKLYINKVLTFNKSCHLLPSCCDTTSVELHIEIHMASKDTPRKRYKKREESTGNISRCRLCNSVADPKHSKSLYLRKNRAILQNAEVIFGSISARLCSSVFMV